jgi:hypothetical protein
MGWGGRKRYGNPDRNQQPIVDLVRAMGGTVEITTGVGDGFPDLVIGWRGLTILVEVKKPGKAAASTRLRESQDLFRVRWTGGPVLDVETATELVQKLIDLDVRTPPR